MSPLPKMYETAAIAKTSKTREFQVISIERNVTGDDDVEFDIKFCGICHKDMHVATDDMGPLNRSTSYPCVPGHELAGIVTKVGRNVRRFRVGDAVGVGCIVDSCLQCRACNHHNEHDCESLMTMTFGADCTHGIIDTNVGYTLGGYSGRISVHNRFIILIPERYPLECAGPVICAGINIYSPLSYWGALHGGKRIGIVGVGSLGQMAIQLARAMRNEVTAISNSPRKEGMARDIGAGRFVVSSNAESMKAAANTLDLILNTDSVNYSCAMFLPLMKRSGVQVILDSAREPHQVPL